MIEKIFTEDEIKLLEDLKLEGINNLNIEDIIRIGNLQKAYWIKLVNCKTKLR